MDPPERKRPVPKSMEPNYDRYKRSKKHENRLSERLGGKRLPRSGGISWSSKWDKSAVTKSNMTLDGDLGTPDFHFEHKRTEGKTLSVAKDWLTKVSEGARRVAKDPGVILTFEKKGQKPEDWALIPLEVLERLLKQAKAEDAGEDR